MARDLKRGDVRWYRFRAPDKRRPVLVLTRNSAIDVLGEVTVAPLTTVIRDIPTEVEVGRHDGLQRDCAVNLDHVQTVSRGRLGGLITRLSRTRMLQVREALLFALGWPSHPD